jgi:hypothetical protein
MTAAFNQLLAQGPTPIKFENPVNQMAQLMQLKNAQQTGVVNQMAIDKGNRQQADQAALRNMLGQTDFNANDPTQRARVLGYEGGADIVSALDSSALNKSKLTESTNKAVASGILNSQNLMANVDPDAPDAVPRLKAIMSATFQNPEVAGFFATHGQTEQGAFDSIDQAASSGKLKGWYTSAMSNAESVRKSMELQGTPQSNEGRIQADMARLPLGSPERASLQAILDKRGQFKPTDEDKPKRQIVVNKNGEFVSVDTNTGLDPTGKPVVGRPTATEQKAKIAEENKKRGLSEAISNINILLGTEATDTTPAVPGVLDVATSSGVGARADAAVNFLGLDENKGQIAAGKAAVLADAVLKIIPRFEGPQSNLDTASYNLAAGQLNNPNVGRKTKIEAAKTLRKMFKERAGQFTTQEEMDAGGFTPPDGAGQTNNPVPEGLSPEDWNLLTPAEQATWKR